MVMLQNNAIICLIPIIGSKKIKYVQQIVNDVSFFYIHLPIIMPLRKNLLN